jgi:hypothetical protein
LYERRRGSRASSTPAFLTFSARRRRLRDRLGRGTGYVKPLAAKEESDLLIAAAPHVEDSIARLFGIEAEARWPRSTKSRAASTREAPLRAAARDAQGEARGCAARRIPIHD